MHARQPDRRLCSRDDQAHVLREGVLAPWVLFGDEKSPGTRGTNTQALTGQSTEPLLVVTKSSIADPRTVPTGDRALEHNKTKQETWSDFGA